MNPMNSMNIIDGVIVNKGTGAGGANTNYYGKNSKKKQTVNKGY